MIRRISLAVTSVLAAGLLVACGDGGGTGSLPTPLDDRPVDTPTAAPPSTPPSQPPTPSTQVPATRPVAGRPLVYVIGGRFDGHPAVMALKQRYPVYFRALVDKDSRLVAASFARYFYADTVALIDGAREAGWVMRPPGSLVVRNVESLPGGIVRVSSCRSQATEYWNPRTRRWVVDAPSGSPDVIDLARRGSGWTFYRWHKPVPKPFSCAGIRYPA